MASGFFFNESGNLEEELELSVDSGSQTQWCEKCRTKTAHYLLAISSTRGHVYTCVKCGQES